MYLNSPFFPSFSLSLGHPLGLIKQVIKEVIKQVIK